MKYLNNQRDISLFSNAYSFLRVPFQFDPYNISCDWVITGVPFDLATSGRSGSRYAPAAIRQASINLAWERCRWPWNFDIFQRLKIIDCGDLLFNIGDAQDASDKLQIHAEKLLFANKRLLTFGGDHYITLPLLRAHAKYFGKLAILHFDAHTDTYIDGGKYDHGTMLYIGSHEGIIDPSCSVQIGIRTMYNNELGFHIIDMHDFFRYGINTILDTILEIIGSNYTYLTFDIDCLDPSIAPGTGTPVVDGFNVRDVMKLLHGVKLLNIIGIDIVEVCPVYDPSQITALSAATLALEMLYIRAASC